MAFRIFCAFLAVNLFSLSIRATAPGASLRLHTVALVADGTFQLHADWSGQAGVILESSRDLKTWAYEWLFPAGDGVISFTDTAASGTQKFYRAHDYVIRFEGIIHNIETEAPIAGAAVRLSFSPGPEPELLTQSDGAGAFQFAVRPAGVGSFQMVIEKSGYEPLTLYGHYAPYIEQLPMRLKLAPPGYRPPNDDFINRATLEGTNITVDASTFAATSEPGHSLTIVFDDVSETYRLNRWWTWTAPMDGAVRIDPDQAHVRAGVRVYTGASLQDLVGVWNSAAGDDGFFVRKGVQYQIAFGTSGHGQAGFNLRMIPPVAPSIRWHPYPGSPMRGVLSAIYEVGEPLVLSAEADGTQSLRYQWRKDGVDIPNATSPFFGVPNVELKDGGAYSILVSNDAGAVLSQEVEITVLLQGPHLP